MIRPTAISNSIIDNGTVSVVIWKQPIIIGKKRGVMGQCHFGIDCDACKFKTEQNCKGCKEIKGNVF